MSSPYSPAFTSSPARTQGPDLNIGDAVSMGAENVLTGMKNVRDTLFGPPLPEGVTNVQLWIDGAPNEEERARRMALVVANKAPGRDEINPAFFETAVSTPPPGAEPGGTMSTMPEDQLAAVLPAPGAPEALSSDPDSPPPSNFHTQAREEPTALEKLYEERRLLQEQTLAAGDETKARLDARHEDLQQLYGQQSEELDIQRGKMDAAFAEQAGKITDFEAQRVALDKVQQKAAATGRAQMQAINDDIQNFKIDPNRAFRSTWQVVGAAIASAAGAYAQGISPNRIPNTAMAIINKAIDRDVLAQKMELGKLKTRAGIQNNVYARLLQLHGDEQRALGGAKVAAITVAEMKVKNLLSTARSTNQKLAGQAMLAKFAYDKEVTMAGIDSKNYSTAAHLMTSAIRDATVAAGKSAGSKGKLSTTERLANIIPMFTTLSKTFSKISKTGYLMHWSKIGKYLGKGAEAADVQAYEQARTLITKEIVSIFEGSKPSDLDWKVMVKLFPLAQEGKGYGLKVIESMKQAIVQRVGHLGTLSPDQRKNQDWGLADWAMKSKLDIDYDDVSQEQVDALKKLTGYVEQ